MMKSSILKWNCKSIVFLFILTIRLTIKGQASDNLDNDGHILQSNQDVSESIKSTIHSIDVANDDGNPLVSPENTTITINSTTTTVPNVNSFNETNIIGDNVNASNAIILSSNSTTTITTTTVETTTTLGRTVNGSIENVNGSVETAVNIFTQTAMYIVNTNGSDSQPFVNSTTYGNESLSVQNTTNNSSILPDPIVSEPLRNVTTTTTTAGIIPVLNTNNSESVVINVPISNQLNETSVVVNTTATTTTTTNIPSVRNVSTDIKEIGVSNNSLWNATFQNTTTTTPLLTNNSTVLNPVQRNDSVNTTLPNLLPVSNTSIPTDLLSNMTLFSNISNNNVTNTNVSSNVEVITSPSIITRPYNDTSLPISPSLNVSNQSLPLIPDNMNTSTIPPILPAGPLITTQPVILPNIPNQNQSSSINNSEVIISSTLSTTRSSMNITNVLNLNLSSSSNVTIARTLTTTILTHSPTLIYSNDSLLNLSNTTEPRITSTVSNTREITNITLTPPVLSLNQSNQSVPLNNNNTYTTVQPNLVSTKPIPTTIQQSIDVSLPTQNPPTAVNQSIPISLNTSQSGTLLNVTSSQLTYTLSPANTSSQNLSFSMDTTQPYAAPISQSVRPVSDISQQTVRNFSLTTPLSNLSNQSISLPSNSSSPSMPLDSIPTRSPPAAIQATPGTVSSITSQSNVLNSSSYSSTPSPFVTLQLTPNNVSLNVSQANNTNQSLPIEVNATRVTNTFTSFTTRITANITQLPVTQSLNGSNQNLSFSGNSTQGNMFVDSSSIRPSFATLQPNNSNQTLPIGANITQISPNATQPSITQSSNSSNQNSSVSGNSTQGNAFVDFTSTRLPSITQQIPLNTVLSSVSQLTSTNQTLSTEFNSTQANNTSNLFTIQMSSNATLSPITQPPNSSIQNLSISGNHTQENIFLNFSSTRSPSVSQQPIVNTVSSNTSQPNTFNQSLPVGINTTQTTNNFTLFLTQIPPNTTQTLITQSSSSLNLNSSVSSNTTQGSIFPNSSSTRSSSFTQQPIPNTVPMDVSQPNNLNQTSSIIVNTTNASNSFTLFTTQTSLIQSSNSLNQNSSISGNTTQGSIFLNSSPTRSSTFTQQPTPNTVPTDASQTSNLNQTVSIGVNTTNASNNFTLFTTHISSNTTQTSLTQSSNSLNLNSSISGNITQGSIFLNYSSTRSSSFTQQPIPNTVPTDASQPNNLNQTLSIGVNTTSASNNFTLFTTQISPNATLAPITQSLNGSTQNAFISDNSTQGNIFLNSSSTRSPSITQQSTANTVPSSSYPLNNSNSNVSVSTNNTTQVIGSSSLFSTQYPSTINQTNMNVGGTISPSTPMNNTQALFVSGTSMIRSLSPTIQQTASVTPILQNQSMSSLSNSTSDTPTTTLVFTGTASAIVQKSDGNISTTFSPTQMNQNVSSPITYTRSNLFSDLSSTPLPSNTTVSIVNSTVQGSSLPASTNTIPSGVSPTSESTRTLSFTDHTPVNTLQTVFSSSNPPNNAATSTLFDRGSIHTFVPSISSITPNTDMNSQATRLDPTIQPSTSTSTVPLQATTVVTNPTQSINTNNERETTQSFGTTTRMTAATDFITSSLLAKLTSTSSFSRSPFTPNIDDHTSDSNKIESTMPTSLRMESSFSNQYATVASTSKLSILLSTIDSVSKVITSSTSTIPVRSDTPVVTSSSILNPLTGYVTSDQSVDRYSTSSNSRILSTLSSISNTNSDLDSSRSTTSMNINTNNPISSGTQTSTLPGIVTTMTVLNPVQTTRTVILSTLMNSITPSNFVSTPADFLTSIRSDIRTTTVNSLSSNGMNIVQSTMETFLNSNNYASQTSSTPIVPNLSSAQASSITSSQSMINNAISSPSTSTSPQSSMQTQATSSSSDQRNLSEITTSTRTAPTSALSNENTSTLSILLTTSGSVISNQTSTNRNTISNASFTTQMNFNLSNITAANDCVFPFLYAGQWYDKCISDVFNDSWCSLTTNFDRDRKWKYCRASRVKTIGGTGNGDDCYFPFVYQGVSFSTCIYRTVTLGKTTSFALFCATTANFDQHGLWGYCLDYGSCYFPFTYNSITYSDCITGPHSARWCSTTTSFDRNKMWTHCPVTCDGYPQQDENSVGFRLLSEQRPCVFKQLISQDTGLILKYYALPTCQLEPLCRDNYIPLFKEIICQEDGRYSYPRTICIRNN